MDIESIKNIPIHNSTSKLCTGIYIFLTIIIGLIYLHACFMIPYNESVNRKSGHLWMYPVQYNRGKEHKRRLWILNVSINRKIRMIILKEKR